MLNKRSRQRMKRNSSVLFVERNGIRYKVIPCSKCKGCVFLSSGEIPCRAPKWWNDISPEHGLQKISAQNKSNSNRDSKSRVEVRKTCENCANFKRMIAEYMCNLPLIMTCPYSLEVGWPMSRAETCVHYDDKRKNP